MRDVIPDYETKSPRTDALIEACMKKWPHISKLGQSVYYENVHQELAPLCREFEQQVAALEQALAESQAALKSATATAPIPLSPDTREG